MVVMDFMFLLIIQIPMSFMLNLNLEILENLQMAVPHFLELPMGLTDLSLQIGRLLLQWTRTTIILCTMELTGFIKPQTERPPGLQSVLI